MTRGGQAQGGTGPFRGLKGVWREFADSSPGERFNLFYDRKQAWIKSHPGSNVVAWIVALLFVAVGVFSFVFPVLPGGVFFVIGVALLGGHSRRLATYLDRAEVGLRRWVCRRVGERRWLACSRIAKSP